MKKTAQILIVLFLLQIFSIQIFYINAQDIVSESLLTEMYSTGEESSNTEIPYNIFISNPSTTSFTLNWMTSEPTTGSVVYGVNTPKLTKRVLDKRDSINNESERYTHSVDLIISSVNKDDTVYFKIISNNLELSNNGESFTYKPINPLKSPPSPISQEGIIETDFIFKAIDRDFLVIGKIGENSTWTTGVPSQKRNTWNLPLGNVLNKTLDNYVKPGKTNKLHIQIYGPELSFGKLDTEIQEDPILILVENGDDIAPKATSPVFEKITPTDEPSIEEDFIDKVPMNVINIIGLILIGLGIIILLKLVSKVMRS